MAAGPTSKLPSPRPTRPPMMPWRNRSNSAETNLRMGISPNYEGREGVLPRGKTPEVTDGCYRLAVVLRSEVSREDTPFLVIAGGVLLGDLFHAIRHHDA